MKKRAVICFIVFLVALIILSACSSSDPVKYTLEISKDGEGTVKPTVGKHQIVTGTVVTLSASPADEYIFEGWGGPDLSKISGKNKILINKNMKIKAIFKEIKNVKGIQFSIAGGTYNGAQSVELSTTTVDADIYYTVDGSDPSASNGTLYSGAITINDDTILKAVAIKSAMTDSSIASADYVINYSLTLNVDPAGSGTITADPDKTDYKYGDTVDLTATAASGYEFSSWSGNITGSTNPETLIIDESKSVTANFVTAKYNVTLAVFDEADNPINGAIVNINGEEKTTDSEGVVVFSLTSGSYSYNVSYNNYETKNGNFDINNSDTLENVVLYYYASTSPELASALEDDKIEIINLDSSEYDLSDNYLSVNLTKELKSTNNLIIYLHLEQNISNISTQNTITMINKVKRNLTMSSDINTGLDTIIESGTLDLSGQQLNINGSIFHKGGTLLVNAGIVDITGDYLIQESPGVASTGYLWMNNVNDQVIVAGNFVMDSHGYSVDLTAGVLEIKGDFTQRQSNTSSTYTDRNFGAQLDHKVILSGVNQTVSFATPASNKSRFANLELASTGTVTFATKTAITGELVSSLVVTPVDSKNLYPTGTALISGGIWQWDLGINEDWILQQDQTVEGDLHLFNGSYDENGYTLTIVGSEIIY